MGQHQNFDFAYGGMLHANKTVGSERLCNQNTVSRKGSIDRSQGCGQRGAGHTRPVPMRQIAGYVVARRHEIVIILGEIIYVNRPNTSVV
jgi:hypothetical protein